ncbi:benzoate/H(+) symporter BenE family transporter [Dongia sedimenti]|uniref:Benzoate/H(+) symporter BenE family transporter n=1 Tax=Dongia sedimenti TaxID=3064282 RepID=A0ABU0YI43_9PROT|nr:benzoate/H(+) symporter BenE family transporter [Rhodospirillaceae bacterium R-7]
MSAEGQAVGRDVGAKAVGPWPPVLAGLLAAVVGYGSSFAIVLQGLIGVGATPAQAESGLLALGTMMGLAAVVFGLRYRMPVAIAWSTPGAALLAATGVIEGGFAAAVGAFIVAGALVVLAGLWKPLGRAVLAIPAPLANAMLAGVLLSFCIAPVKAVAEVPMMALPVVIGWVVVTRFARLYAAPAAVVIAALMYALAAYGMLPGSATATFQGGWQWPILEWVTPAFSWSAMVSIALPLFLVTMASQNIPGFAVLRANGYEPPSAPLLVGTGISTLIAAPFGGHAVNLAAITAAICAGPDAHPDPKRRYIAAVTSGAAYVAMGILAPFAAGFITASPPILIEAVAGLALLGAFGSSSLAFLNAPRERNAALVTFVTTASGFSVFGIGAAFWGLVAGGIVLALHRLGRQA